MHVSKMPRKVANIRKCVRSLAWHKIRSCLYATDWTDYESGHCPVVRALYLADAFDGRVWSDRPVIDERLPPKKRLKTFLKGVQLMLSAPPMNPDGYLRRAAFVAVTFKAGTKHMAIVACTADNDLVYYDPQGYQDIDVDIVAQRLCLREGIDFGGPGSCSLQGHLRSGCCALVCLAVMSMLLDVMDRESLLEELSCLHECRWIRRCAQYFS